MSPRRAARRIGSAGAPLKVLSRLENGPESPQLSRATFFLAPAADRAGRAPIHPWAGPHVGRDERGDVPPVERDARPHPGCVFLGTSAQTCGSKILPLDNLFFGHRATRIQQRIRWAAHTTQDSIGMKATERLHELGQSLWLDNITRDLLDQGALKRYRDEFSVTGLTSNPTIFDRAIANSRAYDDAILRGQAAGRTSEELFFDLALDDLTRAADLFRSIHDRTNGVDGWVSLEVSPLLAHDTASTIAAARALFARAERPNLFIKIPGTSEGLPAIEEAVFAGVPINVTLLFSREQYLAAADAYLRGVERRIAAGLNPRVSSVASVFISRWDVAVADQVPAELRNRLGIAIARRTYRAYLATLLDPRAQRAFNAGAQPQRLLWASTGVKDPHASDTLYAEALAAPFTIDTLPEGTIKAIADHGRIEAMMPHDGGDCEEVLAQFARAGIDVDGVAAQLQDAGARAFVKSWHNLLTVIASKAAALQAG